VYTIRETLIQEILGNPFGAEHNCDLEPTPTGYQTTLGFWVLLVISKAFLWMVKMLTVQNVTIQTHQAACGW